MPSIIIKYLKCKMKNILNKIDEAIASKNTSEETRKLLIEAKKELLRAKTEPQIFQILALIIKIITGFLDN